jgi:hypothetical protein
LIFSAELASGGGTEGSYFTDEDLDIKGEAESKGMTGGARGLETGEPIKPCFGGGDSGGDIRVQKLGPAFGEDLADSEVKPSSSSSSITEDDETTV